MKRRLLLCSTLLLTAASFLAGQSKQITAAESAFAQAAALTATNVQAAFDTVQGVDSDAQVLKYAIKYKGTKDFDASKVGSPLLTPEALAVRTTILQGLKQYASELGALTTSDTGNVDTATTALQTSLTSLTKSAPFKALSTKAAANLKLGEDIFATAIDALGNWLIKRKLRKALPGEITNMNSTIQSICQLFTADIGTVDVKSAEGSDLRQVLWIRYKQEIGDWDTYVSNSYFKAGALRDGLSPAEELAAFKQLFALSAQQKAADQVLAQVAVSLKQMAAAHAKLMNAANSKETVAVDFSDLLAEAQRLNAYYQSLATSK